MFNSITSKLLGRFNGVAKELVLVALGAALPALAAYLSSNDVFTPAITGAAVMVIRSLDHVVVAAQSKPAVVAPVPAPAAVTAPAPAAPEAPANG